MSLSTMAAPAAAEAAAPEKKSKKKLVIMLVALLAIGGGAYWFLLKPAPGPKEPEKGEVVTMEPIQVNLAEGHYLKIGIALQLTATAHEADGSAALDATIELFSGKEMSELSRHESREKLKKELEKELEHAYHGDVMGGYFTDFVTQ